MLAFGLTIVPISVSNGRSEGGARASCFSGGTTTGTATMEGRREVENSGRSRVPDKASSGTVHNGLPGRDFSRARRRFVCGRGNVR
jgi:hypothetical protein